MLRRTLKSSYFRSLTSSAFSSETLPPMATEILHYLSPKAGYTILDMTFGGGGHARKILDTCPDVTLLALDRDPEAYRCALQLADLYPQAVIPLLGRFSDLPRLLYERNISCNSIDCALFDFGCSRLQLEATHRGFSATAGNAPLDMRMDGDRVPDQLTAADVLQHASADDLYRILRQYGQEKNAKKIAHAIADTRNRYDQPLCTTGALSDLVRAVCVESASMDLPEIPNQLSAYATKTFQALRMFVNNEVNETNYGLLLVQRYLKLGGRLVCLTFNHLEDVLVKRHLSGNLIENTANRLPLKYSSDLLQTDDDVFINHGLKSNWQMLTKHVLLPTLDDVERDSRVRTAKFRAAVRIS